MPSPTEALIRAAARLEVARLTGADPTEGIALGVATLALPPSPPGRTAARRSLALAGFLRAWAEHEPPDKAAALIERAEGQELLAELSLIAGRTLS